MTPSRRRTLRTIGVVGGLGAFGGRALAQGDDDAEGEGDPGTAAVRLGHYATDAPAVDVSIDDAEVHSEVSPESVTDYLEIDAGTHDVTITAADEPETVLYEDEIAFGSAFYTLAVVDDPEEEAEVRLLTDANSSLVRLVHVAPDVPPISAVGLCAGPTYFENVGFADQANYVPVLAGTCLLDVFVPADDPDDSEDDDTAADDDAETDAGEDRADEAITTLEFDLEPGVAYSIFVVESPDDEPPFSMHVVEDGAADTDDISLEAGDVGAVGDEDVVDADDEDANDEDDE